MPCQKFRFEIVVTSRSLMDILDCQLNEHADVVRREHLLVRVSFCTVLMYYDLTSSSLLPDTHRYHMVPPTGTAWLW